MSTKQEDSDYEDSDNYEDSDSDDDDNVIPAVVVSSDDDSDESEDESNTEQQKSPVSSDSESSDDEKNDEANEPAETIRSKGLRALGTVLKNQNNINVIESYIHRESSKCDNYDKSYNHIILQAVGDIISDGISGSNLKKILNNIKNGCVLWESPIFTTIKNRIEEHDDFIVNPFEIVEGVSECLKCGSKRVFTFSKQTRGSDEPMSTFAKCVECKANWMYSG